jgi:hypothetical protein
MAKGFEYIARKTTNELGQVFLQILKDDDTVLLKEGDEFVTLITKVSLHNG